MLAGLVFAAVTMWFADSSGGTPDMPLRIISTVKGEEAMAADTTRPALGAVVHRGEPVLALQRRSAGALS